MRNVSNRHHPFDEYISLVKNLYSYFRDRQRFPRCRGGLVSQAAIDLNIPCNPTQPTPNSSSAQPSSRDQQSRRRHPNDNTALHRQVYLIKYASEQLV